MYCYDLLTYTNKGKMADLIIIQSLILEGL